MAEHRDLQAAMLRALEVFRVHGWIKSLHVTYQMSPSRPQHVDVEIGGVMNLTDFCRAVTMEMERPGVLGGVKPIDPAEMMGTSLPKEFP